MARPPILRIHASSSLTEEVFPGKETFFRILREVVMKDFCVVLTEILDRMGVNLSRRKFVHPDLFDKSLPAMEDVLMRNAMRCVISADIGPSPLMKSHENHGKAD